MTKAEYQKYLASDHWLAFSLGVKKKRRVCEECKINDQDAYKKYRQRLNVHHRTYLNVGQERDADVELLCYRCHMKRHNNVEWVDFVQSFSMPTVKSFFPHCANCDRIVGIQLWNVDELDQDYLCAECR